LTSVSSARHTRVVFISMVLVGSSRARPRRTMTLQIGGQAASKAFWFECSTPAHRAGLPAQPELVIVFGCLVAGRKARSLIRRDRPQSVARLHTRLSPAIAENLAPCQSFCTVVHRHGPATSRKNRGMRIFQGTQILSAIVALSRSRTSPPSARLLVFSAGLGAFRRVAGVRPFCQSSISRPAYSTRRSFLAFHGQRVRVRERVPCELLS